MAIEELFNVSCCCSCGLCCSKDFLCERCKLSTLAANGIPEQYVNEIHDLKYKSRNHSNSFKFSELWYKINEIDKRLKSEL